MKWSLSCFVALCAFAAFACPPDARAQTSTPPPVYSGAFGAGLALTGGNTDTVNFNLTFDFVRDPKVNNVIKANGLYLRSSADDLKTADRLSLAVRDEYTISNRVFVYGALPYCGIPSRGSLICLTRRVVWDTSFTRRTGVHLL